jgi:hypothetical protein
MLPAYGRELLELRRSGKRPAQPVYAVGHWELARALRERERFALMVEGELDEFGFARFPRFDFSMLQDLDVVAIPNSLEWIGRVVPQISAARPRSLRRTAIFHLEFIAHIETLWATSSHDRSVFPSDIRYRPSFVIAGEAARSLIERFEAELSAA